MIAGMAAGRGPRVVLVTGQSGIGKSALLAEATRRADGPVLAVRAFTPDQNEAWSLAGQLLGQAARRQLPGRAEAAYRRSLQAAGGLPLFRAWAAARLGALLARRERLGEATPHVQDALAGGTPLTRHEARWAHAELLASQGDGEACRRTAAAALDRARDDGYLILVPRLRALAER